MSRDVFRTHVLRYAAQRATPGQARRYRNRQIIGKQVWSRFLSRTRHRAAKSVPSVLMSSTPPQGHSLRFQKPRRIKGRCNAVSARDLGPASSTGERRQYKAPSRVGQASAQPRDIHVRHPNFTGRSHQEVSCWCALDPASLG